MKQAIAERALVSSPVSPLIFTEKIQQLRRRRKPKSILIRVAAHNAYFAGTNFEPNGKFYLADRLSLEHISCSKLPGRYPKLVRVDGAGGIVMRAKPYDQEVLLLLKSEGDNTGWVLPKGRRKPGERRRQTALREVQEETGIKSLKVKKYLGREGYFVLQNKRVIYKRISYYLMFCTDPNGSLRVHTDEGFIDGRWMKLPEALRLTNPTRAHTILNSLVVKKKKRAVKFPSRLKAIDLEKPGT